jgi:hypothetical protein
VTSVQAGHWQYNSIYWNRSPLGTPSTLDILTLQETGPQTTFGQRPNNPMRHVKGAATRYRSDLFKGNHEFHFGFDYQYTWFGRQYPALPADSTHAGAYSSIAAYPPYQLIFNNGAPFQIQFWNNPAYARVDVRYTDLYFSDRWSLGRHLTFNLGARYAHDVGFVPASCRDAAQPAGERDLCENGGVSGLEPAPAASSLYRRNHQARSGRAPPSIPLSVTTSSRSTSGTRWCRGCMWHTT